MDWLKRNSRLGSVLLLFAAVMATEGWLWSGHHQQSIRALATLEQKKRERDWFARLSPALSEENEQAIARDLTNTQKVLAALCSALEGSEARTLGSPPAKAIDLYFYLADFVEKTRGRAARAQVTAKPDERFGFASYANEGPEADLVPAVFRQGVAGQFLVEALIEAHPRSILAVQRERPLTAALRAQRNQLPQSGSDAVPTFAPGGQPGDFFDFDPQLSVRAPGRVDSEAFRLEFTGQTTALRAFLNTLASFERPVIVRSVEVEPLASGDPMGGSVLPGAPVPLVAQNFSRLAVIVEFLQPVPVPGKSAP